MKLMSEIPCSRQFRLSYLSYFRCLSSTYLHLRRTRDDRLQCGMSFIHFLVFQIFAHPARHVAQHFTFDHEVPHFPFIKIFLHLRLGNTFLQTVGPVGPGQAGQTPPQSTFSSFWFRMPSSQVSGQAGQTPPQSTFYSSWFRMPSSQVSQFQHVVLSVKSKTTPAAVRGCEKLTALLTAGTK